MTTKIHGRIHLTQYTSYNADSKDDVIPTYKLLAIQSKPTKSSSKALAPTDVLLDTGASVSLMPLKQANELGVEIRGVST